jgi:hypothetical protein
LIYGIGGARHGDESPGGVNDDEVLQKNIKRVANRQSVRIQPSRCL